MQRFDVAESLLREGLELADASGPGSSRAQVHEAFVELYTAWGRPADAARYRSVR
jgi:hypothetical protein